MEFLYYLKPVYDSANSFYKKAKVYRDDKGHLFLESYSTIVAKITDSMVTGDGRRHAKTYGWYSRTTARHINDFLYQHGFKPMTKKQMEASNYD